MGFFRDLEHFCLNLGSRFRQSSVRRCYHLLYCLVRHITLFFLICTYANVILRCRKPLGEPDPQAPNLALAVVLLVVIMIQAIFNAWQGMIDVFTINACKYSQIRHRLLYRPCHGLHIQHVTYGHSRNS